MDSSFALKWHCYAILILVVAGCGDSAGGPGLPPPPPPMSWIRSQSLPGAWDFRGYFVHQAGCWSDGGGTVCLVDSVLEAFSGTVQLDAVRDSFVTSQGRYWRLPAHIRVSVEQWDYDGACDGQPLSCFTSRSPTASFSHASDSILEITQNLGGQAVLVLRDGRLAAVWRTSDTTPTSLYDSVPAAPMPEMPGVRHMQRRP